MATQSIEQFMAENNVQKISVWAQLKDFFSLTWGAK